MRHASQEHGTEGEQRTRQQAGPVVAGSPGAEQDDLRWAEPFLHFFGYGQAHGVGRAFGRTYLAGLGHGVPLVDVNFRSPFRPLRRLLFSVGGKCEGVRFSDFDSHHFLFRKVNQNN